MWPRVSLASGDLNYYVLLGLSSMFRRFCLMYNLYDSVAACLYQPHVLVDDVRGLIYTLRMC